MTAMTTMQSGGVVDKTFVATTTQVPLAARLMTSHRTGSGGEQKLEAFYK